MSLRPRALKRLLMIIFRYLLTLLARVARICELRLLLRLRALELCLGLLRSELILLYRVLSILLLRNRALDLVWIGGP